MTYHTHAFISFVGELSEVTLLGNLTHSLTIESVSGHAPLGIHAFQTQGLRKSSMENLRGHTNSPLLPCSQPTCIYQLLRQSFCPCKLLLTPLGDHANRVLRAHQLHPRHRVRFHPPLHHVLLPFALYQLPHEDQFYITLNEYCVCSYEYKLPVYWLSNQRHISRKYLLGWWAIKEIFQPGETSE